MSNYKVQFNEKPLEVIQTVAELFVFARTQRCEELEEIARTLQISPFYLEALECGNYGQLPSCIYTRNFVRTYGSYLGLNTGPLIELFHQEWQLFEKHQQQLFTVQRKKGVSRSDLWRMPRWVRWSLSAVVVCSMFAYLGYELYALRQPPTLAVYSPNEEVVTDKQVIQIAGKTEPEVSLSINNQTILSDASGNFNETVALQPGLNVIAIQAKKKYSRENTIYRKVVVQEKPAFSDATDQEHRS